MAHIDSRGGRPRNHEEAGGEGPLASNRSNGIPSWMIQEKVSLAERLEVRLYQLISVFPVFVTFGLYTYLLVFYVGVSLDK